MQDITPLPIARSDSGPSKGYGSVPVKKPASSASLTQQVDNPIATDARTLAQFASEAEMDKILDDINRKVQADKDKRAAKKGVLSFLKRPEKKTQPPAQAAADAKDTKQPPISAKKRSFVPVAVIAVIVAIALCAFAFAAFAKQNPSQPAAGQNQESSSANQSNASVTAEDVDKLLSDIKDQTESLSTEENWAPQDLSDSSLGL